MINKDNLKEVLKKLNFEENDFIFTKHFPDSDAYLKVDFKKGLIVYPEDKGLKINSYEITSFSKPEFFVQFECIHRLLEKGYKPEHIELEPKWKVGHGASGGEADILVKDNSGKSLLIIECKTEGNEFKKEWNNTLQRGGQMLTYAKQAGTTQYVCLYASDFADGKIIPNYYIISLKDNEKLLEELKDKKPLSFADAKALEVEDIYKAWKETYNLDYSTKGIFEDDILPYQIGKTKFSTADLLAVGSKDIQSKYHEFATIMRQHNVSGRENAFDKLVNLFLCKIVDENKNPKDLKFNWKGIAYDSYFDLQDRLQLLYQSGMKEFLGEDVTYIDNKAIDKAFRFFTKDPDATRETIKKYFRQLKFFTNNDFAFIDVHNEKLFYQNSEVLLKIVQMLQDIKLQDDNQEHQFLGDMFEGFLDNGVKQSEGQFFTPMPIVKFILNSLPLESIIQESELPPKAIDYACGAGHFLNELALQVKPFVAKHKETDIKEYYKEIVGIEKEYRLSKVAKVSAFMYGQDDIKITYADALGNNSKLQDNDFSVLVANPPYAVKGFLQTLSEIERKSFTLFNLLDEKSLANNNSIETFFIERAKQLLKPGAVAGIILPSSIISKEQLIYTANRGIILKYFNIISIVEFGNKTFGKTGTNTVTLFLRRKEENPAPADHWKNRVDAWFTDNEADAVYSDGNYINMYCNHIEIDTTQYKTLLTGKPSEELLKNEMFLDYKKAFDNFTEIKNLLKQKTFKDKAKAEQDTELTKRFIDYLQSIEKDKLYFYVLASENQKVLIVKCPTDNKEQKAFLGYDWSSAKGSEGIKYINQTTIENEIDDEETKEMLEKIKGLQSLNTPLYNPQNRLDPTKINHFIEQNFLGNELEVPEILSKFITYYSLVEMLDFNRVSFNKQISLVANESIKITTKHNLAKFGDLISENVKSKIQVNEAKDAENGEYPFFTSGETVLLFNSFLVENENIYLSTGGNSVVKYYNGRASYSTDTWSIKSKDESTILTKYIFFFLNSIIKEIGNYFFKGVGLKHLQKNNLKDFKIPLPPKEIQQKIVKECNAIDKELEKANIEIEKANTEIENKIVTQLNDNFSKIKLVELTTKIGSGSTPTGGENAYKESGITLIRSMNIYDGHFQVKGLAFIDDVQAKKLDNVSVEKDDVLLNITGASVCRCFIVPEQFLPARVNQHVSIIRFKKEKVLPKFGHRILISKTYKNELLNLASGASTREALTKEMLENFKIPIPPIAEQDKLIKEIEKLEDKIKVEQAKIDSSADKKKEIMKKYL